MSGRIDADNTERGGMSALSHDMVFGLLWNPLLIINTVLLTFISGLSFGMNQLTSGELTCILVSR